MAKVYISYGKAVSLKTVSEHVAKVLVENNVLAETFTQFYPQMIRRGDYTGVMFVYPCDPVYASEKASYYILVKPRFKDKTVWYTTIEGKPLRTLIQKPLWKYIDFVANSQYTRKVLESHGLHVEKVVYHGVDFEEVRRAEKLAKRLRRKIEKDFPDKVVFGTVSASHFRKGLDKLYEAVASLPSGLAEKTVFLIVSEKPFLAKVESEKAPKNMFSVAEMGSKSREEILAFMGACDFTIFPSLSEGFGLPVLESMAMGTPVLHCWFEPLSEFSPRNANITWDYLHIREKEGKGGLIFTLHEYDPEDLVEAIEKAVHLKLNEPEKYEKISNTVREASRKFDIRVLYKYFADRFGEK